jgi:signal transduction histidine kinase/ActR/RegA family two-component response regulator
MSIRDYLITLIIICTLAGGGVGWLQFEFGRERLHAESEISLVSSYGAGVAGSENSLQAFFITWDVYMGSEQKQMLKGVHEQKNPVIRVFRELAETAPTEQLEGSARKVALLIENFDLDLLDNQTEPLGNNLKLLAKYEDASVEIVNTFGVLKAETEALVQVKREAAIQLGTKRQNTVLFAGFGFVVLVLLLLRWTLRSIATPIAALALGAEAVIEDGTVFRARRKGGASEVIRLTDSIEQMTTSLESLVAQRTEELNENNVKLTEEIARRAETEKSLMDAKIVAESANKAKSSFLAVMSHELRTPLNAILGFTEILRDEIQGPITDSQGKSVAHIHESGKHLLALINDILDLSKIEAGKELLRLERFDVEPLCTEAVGMLMQAASKKNLLVKTAIDPACGEMVADRRRVRQILFNLLSNAIKFTPDGRGIGLEVVPLDESTLRFTVWDRGIGIDKEAQKTLFLPFVQVDSKLARQYEGTGLGLSLVLRLAEMHSGQVELKSELGKGSRFSVRLPRQVGTVGESADESSLITSGTVGRPCVLLVEDNELNQLAFAQYLESNGYELFIANDGKQALNVVSAQKFNLILMDIQLPEMDGTEVIRRIRAMPGCKDIPILALTALVMGGDAQSCMAAGADGYLSKPVELKRLLRKSNQLMSQAAADRKSGARSKPGGSAS